MGLLEVLIALFAIGTPLALYFVMVRARSVHEGPKAPSGPDLSEPPADFGLSNDAHPVTPGRGDADEDGAAASSTNSTAAAAGGALVLGWEVTHRDSDHQGGAGGQSPAGKGGTDR